MTDGEGARARAAPGRYGLLTALRRVAMNDVLTGRHDLDVARLTEVLQHPSGWVVSRARLRADDFWDPLRGRSDFARLVADDR